MTKKAGRFLLILLLFSISSWLSAKEGVVNQGLLNSPQNLQSNLILTEVPLGLIGVQDEVTLKWTPDSMGVLRYSPIPGGSDPTKYPFTINPADLSKNTNGVIGFLGEKLTTGIYYCIITSVSGTAHSTEFIIIREADVSPRIIGPRSARDEPGIKTNSPIFTWEEVNGVPFYHVILSDQPFSIVNDEEGNPQTEGANIIWQAIVSGNSIAYGTPDPSGFFTITSPPPLVKGVRYNWLVLNNYGNNPALSSSVISNPSGFEIEVPPPFKAPENIEPARNAIVTSKLITFRWTEIEGASLYHLYLSRFEDLNGSTVLLPVWDGVTSNNLLDLSTAVLQQEGTYYWKILAQNESGNGVMGDTTSFFYSAKSAKAKFIVRDLKNTNLRIPRATLTLESLTSGASPTVLPTGDNGTIERSLPLGSYKVSASKEGYEDTTVVFTLSVENVMKNVFVDLRESPSAIYGSTIDASQSPLPFVTVEITSQSSGEKKEVVSDINGKFSLGLSSDDWMISASKSGYKSAPERIVSLGPGVDLNLDEAANGGPLMLAKNIFHLNGLVTTSSGEALWGAKIVVSQGSEKEETVSDAQGQYSVILGTGTWTVTVSKAGYVSPQPQEISIIDHNISLNLALIPQANILSGTVTGAGVPLGDAEVLAIPNSGQTITVITNTFGQYTLSLGKGTYQIIAKKKGYISPDPTQFSLTVGQTISGVNLNLEAENSFITGEVTSDGVTPLSGVTITNGTEIAITDLNGRYKMGVRFGSHIISASKEGYLSNEEKEVVISPGQTLAGIDFILTPNASIITGSIKNGSLPVNNATVIARNKTGVHKTPSDQKGNYSLSLTAGTYVIKAEKSGFVSTPDSIVVTVNPGQTVIDNNFSFVENLSYLSGIVKSVSDPLRNTTVEVQALGTSHSYSTLTGVDGKFNLAVLPGFRYSVTVKKTGYFGKTDTTNILILSKTTHLIFELSPHQSLISGNISTAEGVAIGNAKVKAVNATSVFTTTSNAQGNYDLGVDAGAYELTVQKSGFIPVTRQVTVGLADTLSGEKFSLTPNYASLDGFITNPLTGKGIERVLVVATESGGEGGGSVRTDAQGHYILQNLPLGVYKITVSHPSYIKKVLENKVFAGGSANHINIKLTPKDGQIAGKVTSNGAGISGVTITASSAGGSISAVTTNDGSYRIKNLTPATYTVQASLIGYTSSPPRSVTVQANDTSQANFTVTPNEGKIVGFVRENTAGMRGAKIIAIGQKGNTGSAISGADGSYSILNLATDSYQLYVKLDRYSSSPDTASTVLLPGETNTVNFSLTRSVIQISGTVRDQGGNLLANIKVIGESPKGTQTTTTNANGEFQLLDLPTNTQYTVKTDIFEEGYQDGDSLLNAKETDISGVNLLVGIFRSKIRGNVGLANASITAEHLQSQQIYTTLSQNDGSYFIKNLYDGDYQISVAKVGYKATPAQKSVENLGISEDRSGVNFTMTEIKIAISGMIKDSQGAPLPNVPVLVWSSSASRIDTTGNDGIYSVTGLPPNLTYEVQTKLLPLDYENISLTVEAKEANISNPDLTVKVHNSIIEGKVSRTTGEAIEDATVSIVELNLKTNTDAQGNYRFAHLYPGTYTLKVRKAGFEEVAPDTIILAQGESKSHHVSSLTPLTAAISGVVSDKDGILANVFIDIIDESTKQIVRQDTTDNNGIYSVKNLQIDKKYTATAANKGYSNSTQAGIDLSSGAVTVNLQLKPLANSFFGKVLRKSENLEAAKNGVSDALVKINGLAGGSWSDSTDAYGVFSITGLTSGTYSIVAEKGDSISSSQTVTLVSGGSRKLRLFLEKTGDISGIVTYQGVGRPGVNVTAINSLAGTVSSAVTGTDGRYIIKGLLNGVYTVSSEIAGFSVANSPKVATITSGSSEQIDFVLKAENNSIIGTISDTESNLISGASVKISNATMKDSSTSDINGQFKFTGLSDGTYQIEAKLAGFKSPLAQAITLTGGQPAIVDIQLTAIKNSISGFVKDGASGNPIKGAIVKASNNQGGVFSDTTGNDGSYLFELKNPGDYQLHAQKAGYEESEMAKLNLPLGASLVQDLILTPIITTSTISGTIFKKGGAVAGARVVCLSLSDVSVRDTVISDNSGKYLFSNLLVPGNYLLEVTKAGLPGLSSPVLELTENGINYDFLFPSAQLKWKITREGTTLLPGVSIAVNSNSRDIRLITDNNGEAATEENLTQGDFLVTINKDHNSIPPNRYSVNLPSDSATVLGDIYLPFVHHPADSVSSQDSLEVTVLSWVVPEDTLWLNYRGVDALSFKKMPLMKNVSPADTVKSDTMYYSAMLPPQKSAGKLTYFITTQFRGHVYSNEGNPFETEVTNQGILSSVNLNFESKKVPVGVPVFLQVRAYDGINQPLTPQKVSWEIIRGQNGNFSRFSADSTKAWFNSDVGTTYHIEVRVTIGDVSLTANAVIKTEEKVLSSLKIGSPVLETSNRSPVLFTYSAMDTSGVLISIFPLWSYSPRSSGTLIPSEDGQNALFQPDTNYFGQLQIFLQDSLSGKKVAFNATPEINVGDRGLKVFQVVPENNRALELNDGGGFTMIIPENVVEPGINLKFKLSTPQVPDVKKFTGKFKVAGKIYDINVSGRFKENREFVLKFPVPNAVKDKELQIGHWNIKSLSWTPIESTREGDHIIANTTHFSQFSVLQANEALGARNLKLLPNPFTAHDDQGLQISFNLTSNDIKKPFVTIKVYNMRGDLVKIIKENEPMDPIEYQPGAINTPKWDGTTEDGKLARNGRYLVVIKVRDSGGEKTEMRTVVLIK